MNSKRGTWKNSVPKYSEIRSDYDLRSKLRSNRYFGEFIQDQNEQSRKLSWAEQCEAVEEVNSVNSPMKALQVSSPGPQNNRKRERNRETAEKIAVSPSLDGIKRRLGWNRAQNYPDDVSTESSSLYSSDNELDGDRNVQYETDPVILARRQKQIDYGKNTKGYRLYLEAIPKNKREAEHIYTPKKHVKYSRRSWDCQIKTWRKRLHEWDPKATGDAEEDVDLSHMVKNT